MSSIIQQTSMSL